MIEELHESLIARLDEDNPVTMLNLMKFHPRSLDGNGTGWEAYLRYSQLTIKEIKRRGGSITWAAQVKGVPLGPTALGDWDYAALVYYPAPSAFLEMMQSSEYAAANVHRVNGCERHLILATEVSYSKLRD